MARMPAGTARSVADPDAAAYDESMRQQRPRNTRTSGLPSAGRQPGRGIYKGKVAATLDLAGNMSTTAEIVPGVIGHISADPRALAAARSISKANRVLGPVTSAGSSLAQYGADRDKGMPRDEALLKNACGFALGLPASARAAAACAGLLSEFPPVAIIGGAMCGLAGDVAAKKVSTFAAEGVAGLKDLRQQVQQTISRNLQTLNSPSYWVYGRERRGGGQ